jgi:heptosyltransferase-3
LSLLSAIYNLAVLGRLKDDPGPFDPAQVKKILVVRNDNIGDVICTTPMLDALRAAFPQAFIAALVCTLTQEAIEGHRALDRLWAYPKAKHGHYGKLESLRRLGAALGEIRRERFDLVLAPRAQFSSSQAWLVYASRGRWRVGPEARGKRKRWGFYYNMPTPWPPGDMHEVERCFHLLNHIQVDSLDKRLYVKVPAQAKAKVADFLQSHGLDRTPGPLVLNITRWAYREGRNWPDQRYQELLQGLASRSEGLVVTHAPGDDDWVAGLLAGIEPRPPVFWSRSLKEFCGLIARAKVFITPEGGPMHLGAAMGRPLVVVWARASRAVWTPWGVPSRLIGGEGRAEEVQSSQVLAALDDLLRELPQGVDSKEKMHESIH